LPICAIIPARGGSKGLPRKNVRLLCGKPLIAWTIEAALQSELVNRVVVSTDDGEIAEVSRLYGAEVVWRPKEISGDDSPSEAALLHGLEQLRLTQGVVAFLQCTSPLMLPADIDGTVRTLDEADSAFTATRWHHFLWRDDVESAQPLGHDKNHRPMRQHREPQYLEVGAVYAMDIAGFLKVKHRFFGVTRMYLIPAERSLEIDDATDLLLAETLLRQRMEKEAITQLPHTVSALVMDFDGVLTDNRVSVIEDGKEVVTCHRGDGWAIQRFRTASIRLLVLTNEDNASVAHRCRKLNVERITTQGAKLPVLQSWLHRQGVAPENTIYVGNDVTDVPCMRYVGAGVAPADACLPVKQSAKLVLSNKGGYGCIRELAEILLAEQEV
jgi:YrbI family 3-deoxy-D-manno-octulosonate 8-phosphate phosphatase